MFVWENWIEFKENNKIWNSKILWATTRGSEVQTVTREDVGRSEAEEIFFEIEGRSKYKTEREETVTECNKTIDACRTSWSEDAGS
jgi:hypothetical protein